MLLSWACRASTHLCSQRGCSCLHLYAPLLSAVCGAIVLWLSFVLCSFLGHRSSGHVLEHMGSIALMSVISLAV